MTPTAHERVTRAPSDVLRLLVATTAVVAITLLSWLFGQEVADFLADLFRGLSALPQWLVTAVLAAQQVLALVLIGGGLVTALVQRRWVLVLSASVAVAAALGLLLVLGPILDADAARVTDIDESRILIDPSDTPSAAVLAAVTAIVTAGAPWISRRWRRAGWALVILFALVRALGAPVSAETAAALLVGWVAGSATVVLLGAPSRRPTQVSIVDGLATGGVELARLEPASVDARGSTPYFGETRDGVALFVKALGEDERSADVMFRLYRRIQPKDLGDEKSFSSLRRTVEHEALVACVARDVGVRTPRFVAFAQADPNGYVLAYEAIEGRSLDRVEPGSLTDDVLDECWQQLLVMRHRRIAHRDLRLANVFLDERGQVWIIDFGFSELAASDLLLATDVAELLASSSTRVGAERAVEAGRRALGVDELATALPRLQPSMLSGATRTSLKAAPGALEDLRTRLEPASARR